MGDPVSRRRIASLLGGSDFEVVASGSTVAAMLDSARLSFEAAVLIGGADLLGRSGAVEGLRNLRPGCPMVVVAQSHDRSLVRKALRAGVDGFVHHADVERVLRVTLEAVVVGQLSVPQTIRNRIAWTALSIREKQVLQLVANGLTNSEVAGRLYLSESTVKSHLSSSFRKLGVSSRAEAAAVVLDPDSGLGAIAPTTPLFSLERELLGHAVA
jgi:DNA-binding NarL/FixJ family response regulator